MALTKKERLEKLDLAETGKEYHDLYKEVFGVEYPETVTRNPNDDIENLVQAIFDNVPVEKVNLPKDAKI
tara:strand:- start:11919 stop:12128 length:210 start_codon:yes stop_codon:yes gene_type:complete